MFLTTKLAARFKDYEGAVKAIDGSLERMGLDYIDMMIIHSPQPWDSFGEADRFLEGNRAAWRALEEAHDAGKLRAIGLSNFAEQDVDNILESCSVKPVVNQVLAHISNTPWDLIQHSQDKGLLVEAYSRWATANCSRMSRSPRWRASTTSPSRSSASATTFSSACCRSPKRPSPTT